MKFPPSDKWVNHWIQFGIAQMLVALVVFLFGFWIAHGSLVTGLSRYNSWVLVAGVVIAFVGLFWMWLIYMKTYRTWGRRAHVVKTGYKERLGKLLEADMECSFHDPLKGMEGGRRGAREEVCFFRVRGKKGSPAKKGLLIKIRSVKLVSGKDDVEDVRIEVHLERNDKKTRELAASVMSLMEEMEIDLGVSWPVGSALDELWVGISQAEELSKLARGGNWEELEKRRRVMTDKIEGKINRLRMLLEVAEEGGVNWEELSEDVRDAGIDVPDRESLVALLRSLIGIMKRRAAGLEELAGSREPGDFGKFEAVAAHDYELHLQEWIASGIEEEPSVRPEVTVSERDMVEKLLDEMDLESLPEKLEVED